MKKDRVFTEEELGEKRKRTVDLLIRDSPFNSK